MVTFSHITNYMVVGHQGVSSYSGSSWEQYYADSCQHFRQIQLLGAPMSEEAYNDQLGHMLSTGMWLVTFTTFLSGDPVHTLRLAIVEDRASQASLTMNLSVREVIRRLVGNVEMNMILEENTIWEFPKRCSPIESPRRPVNEPPNRLTSPRSSQDLFAMDDTDVAALNLSQRTNLELLSVPPPSWNSILPVSARCLNFQMEQQRQDLRQYRLNRSLESGYTGGRWEAVDALNGQEIAQMEFRESFWMIASLVEYMEPQHQLKRAPHLWNRIREDIEILISSRKLMRK